MTAWRHLASCAGMSGPDRDPWADRALEAVAKAVCAGCPVQAECLADATDDRWTVRGGLTVKERDALTEDPDALPGMPPAAEVELEHGLRATYGEGCRCGGCVAANTKFVNEWRAKKLAEPESQPEQADWQMTFDMGATA